MKKAAIVVFLICTSLGVISAQDVDITPPGEFVSVNNHQLHVDCRGEGQPMVIIEAGLASWSIHWRSVQTDIADFTRACTYDRAGYGWSEAGPEPRTVEQLTDEFAQLLTSEAVGGPPFILVGHSFGSLIVQSFYGQFPEQVVGLILVDGPNPNAETPLPAGWLDATVAIYTEFPEFAEFAAQGFITPESIDVPDFYPQGIQTVYQRQVATPGFFTTTYSEITHLAEGMATVDAELDDFENLPLVVILPALAQTPDETAEMDPELVQAADEANAQQQFELAGLSTQGELIRAENSSHDTIQFIEPNIITEAVRSIMETIVRNP